MLFIPMHVSNQHSTHFPSAIENHTIITVRTFNYVSSHREGSFLLLRYLYGNADGKKWLPFALLPPLQPRAANLL